MTGSLFTVTSSSAVIVWLQNAAWPRCCLQTLNERTHMHRKEKKKKRVQTHCFRSLHSQKVLNQHKRGRHEKRPVFHKELADRLWLRKLCFNFLHEIKQPYGQSHSPSHEIDAIK